MGSRPLHVFPVVLRLSPIVQNMRSRQTGNSVDGIEFLGLFDELDQGVDLPSA